MAGERHSGSTSLNPGNAFNGGAACVRMLWKLASWCSEGLCRWDCRDCHDYQISANHGVGSALPSPRAHAHAESRIAGARLWVGACDGDSVWHTWSAGSGLLHPSHAEQLSAERGALVRKPHHRGSLVAGKIQILVKIGGCKGFFPKCLQYVPVFTVTFCEFLTMVSDSCGITTVNTDFCFPIGNTFRKHGKSLWELFLTNCFSWLKTINQFPLLFCNAVIDFLY